MRTLAVGTATSTGTGFLRSLVRHVALALGADVAFLAEVEEGGWERAHVLASHTTTGADLPEGSRFLISGTPCSLAAGQEIVSLPTGTRDAFPEDAYASRNRLDGYLVIVVRGTDASRLGYLGIMSKTRLEPTDEELAVLAIFASRAGAEIERRRHEAALRRREAEVAASRSRLVSVADEERRRIGRNLHDGAQQRLVVLGHRIELARRKLAQGAGEEALEHLAAAADEAREAGAELRELARGLHPAGLAEYGLEPALAGLAQRSPLPVDVVALPDRRLPEVIEVTIYYLVSEALTNAVKYAQAGRARVEVVHARDRVITEVSDDGVGGADAGTGSGLRGLSERVEALGGTLEVESPAGEGTRLRATVPLGPWRTAREPFLEFGHAGDGGAGERSIAQILAGEKTAAISLAREWELEGGTPRIGQQLPIIDHHGKRRGLVEVVRVSVMPFGEVDAGSVADHDPGGMSHDEWVHSRRRHYEHCREQVATLLGEPDWRLSDAEPMVVLRFRRR